ncbi:XRE family transcriptional regulator [Clostridium botulinum]|uniref:helix-turn-helix domain-containing protein n=1 Tax=Clostridium botulinum TaxID=1491 RepID=UPI001969C5E1|nr:helix-turn-helix transcriptional regulator [Clostridium botulinum]MBN3368747.1 XRE family transcriptional regulator [Clostridium botulinum]MBN3376191.1 XRE family transcriptional regulator [Clostridium botulinum]
MTTSDMIRQLCEKMNISQAELCRRIGQTPQNFNKKLKRGTVSSEEMMAIAEALGVGYEQAFVLPGGSTIKMGNRPKNIDEC